MPVYVPLPDKARGARWSSTCQASPNGFVQHLFKGDATFANRCAEHLFDVRIERDGGPHNAIVASNWMLSRCN